jgi:dTDP-4-dehydrorhamnose reductase
MKILLTGCSGQVGYELARSLQSCGEVIAMDRSTMDLNDMDSVRAAIRSVRPALIVNPAAYTAVDQAEREPELAMRVNGEAPGVMAEEAARLGAAMIQYSTDYVFDGGKAGGYVESDAANPLSVYGRTKLAGERAVQAAGIPHLILRTSWVYGMRGKNFLLTIRRLARERDELRIVADQHGAPTWCRTIADSTANIVAQLGDARNMQQAWQDASGIYHLTAQGQTTWHGFAQAIVARLPGEVKPRVVPIATEDYPLPAARPRHSVLSCERLMHRFCRLPDWQTALALSQE